MAASALITIKTTPTTRELTKNLSDNTRDRVRLEATKITGKELCIIELCPKIKAVEFAHCIPRSLAGGSYEISEIVRPPYLRVAGSSPADCCPDG